MGTYKDCFIRAISKLRDEKTPVVVVVVVVVRRQQDKKCQGRQGIGTEPAIMATYILECLVTLDYSIEKMQALF